MPTSQSANKAAESARAAASEVRDRIRGEGERAVDTARENARTFAAQKRDFAGEYLDDVSDALGSAESTLHERGRTGTARMVQGATDEVHRLADRVHGQDVGQMITEVETFARTRPALFFGGAFALGFALTRVLGAPSEGSHREASRSPGHAIPDSEQADTA